MIAKSDLSEIKKTFTIANTPFDHVEFYFTNEQGDIISSGKHLFRNLEESMQHKFMAIAKKVLSGNLGNDVVEIDVNAFGDINNQADLLRLRDALGEDGQPMVIESFVKNMMPHVGYYGNAITLFFKGGYDIPDKTTDKLEVGESVEYLDFFICVVCPVEPDKPGLSVGGDPVDITLHETELRIKSPEIGFMFPAFSERSMDVNVAAFYAKDTKDPHEELTTTLFGSVRGATIDEQKDAFTAIVEEALGEETDVKFVRAIQEAANEVLADDPDETVYSDEPKILKKEHVREIFETAGVAPEIVAKAESCFEEYEENNEKAPIITKNVVEPEKFDLKSTGLHVNISGSQAHNAKVQIVDGVKSLVIPLQAGERAFVNGVRTDL